MVKLNLEYKSASQGYKIIQDSSTSAYRLRGPETTNNLNLEIIVLHMHLPVPARLLYSQCVVDTVRSTFCAKTM